ncbi:MAG: putative glycosyltransferase, partial [Gemmatimonadetes bacterium]|nr:putative glycosyltransferase [Gemmatimonadota bacterium]
VEDVLRGDYPADRLRIVVGVDAGSPEPLAGLADALAPFPAVEVVEGDPPGGKAAALNAAVRAGSGEVLVFTDTAQRFAANAISQLARCMGLRGAGGASGHLRARGDTGVLGRFWNYETWVRQLESDLDSLVGVTGAVYALRREAWHDLRGGLINDDLAVPLLARKSGFRVVHCPEAEAMDERSFGREQQYQRRVRTLTGIYQLVAWYPWIGSPGANPLWVQFILHKVVRLATPYLLAITALWVLATGGWRLAVAGLVAVVLLGAALAGFARRSPIAVAREAGWTLKLLILAPLAATRNAVRGDWDVWRGRPGRT